MLVLGCGAVLLVSFLPSFEPPGSPVTWFRSVCALAILLEAVSLLRRERGNVAVVAVAVAACATGLLVLTFVMPVAYGLGMDLFMAN